MSLSAKHKSPLLRTHLLANDIHSYPFKNTVKLWAYKNNSEHICTTSRCLLFIKSKYKNVFEFLMCLRRFLSFISENKDKLKKGFSYCLFFFFLILGREKVLHTCTFLTTSIAFPAVREHFEGFVCIKYANWIHMSTHKTQQISFWEIASESSVFTVITILV